VAIAKPASAANHGATLAGRLVLGTRTWEEPGEFRVAQSRQRGQRGSEHERQPQHAAGVRGRFVHEHVDACADHDADTGNDQLPEAKGASQIRHSVSAVVYRIAGSVKVTRTSWKQRHLAYARTSHGIFLLTPSGTR